MGALQDFQEALYTALAADSTLTGLIGGSDHISDWPKPKGPFPLVTIGEDREAQWLNKNESNYQIDAVINVWSQKRGWKECNQIVDRLDVILLENLLALDASSSFTIIGKGQRPDAVQKLPDPDNGLIRRIRAVYKFWLSC